MKITTRKIGETLVYSFSFAKKFSDEQLIRDHTLLYQLSGETRILHQTGTTVIREGQVSIISKNQFTKNIRTPAAGKDYRAVALNLASDRLKQFALDNGIVMRKKYDGPKSLLLPSNAFLTAYFQSLNPYIENDQNASPKLGSLKISEVIELLIELHPELRGFLFDFDNPKKSDLQQFMLGNFRYNAPIEHFAKLSGRSLTTFKRDFAAIFRTSPSKWLIDKRLSESYRLISQKNQRPREIYIELGFQNLSHFYKIFKLKYGHTPAGIRSEMNDDPE
jgi:AraC-like DNA-binding protein